MAPITRILRARLSPHAHTPPPARLDQALTVPWYTHPLPTLDPAPSTHTQNRTHIRYATPKVQQPFEHARPFTAPTGLPKSISGHLGGMGGGFGALRGLLWRPGRHSGGIRASNWHGNAPHGCEQHPRGSLIGRSKPVRAEQRTRGTTPCALDHSLSTRGLGHQSRQGKDLAKKSGGCIPPGAPTKVKTWQRKVGVRGGGCSNTV